MTKQPTHVLLDVESTGINTASDRIIEVAVIAADTDGNPVGDPWVQRINPGLRWVPAYQVHHLTAADLDGQPTFGDVADHITALINGRIVVGHYVGFDLAIINAELARAGRAAVEPAGVVDTVELARMVLPGLPNRRLVTVANHLGVRWAGRQHRAAGDAMVCGQVLGCLNRLGKTRLAVVGADR